MSRRGISRPLQVKHLSALQWWLQHTLSALANVCASLSLAPYLDRGLIGFSLGLPRKPASSCPIAQRPQPATLLRARALAPFAARSSQRWPRDVERFSSASGWTLPSPSRSLANPQIKFKQLAAWAAAAARRIANASRTSCMSSCRPWRGQWPAHLRRPGNARSERSPRHSFVVNIASPSPNPCPLLLF